MKLIIPPIGNQTILMLKTTSLVSVLALTELLYSAQATYARTFQTMPLLIVVSLWCLALTSILTVGQYFLEALLRRRSWLCWWPGRVVPAQPAQYAVQGAGFADQGGGQSCLNQHCVQSRCTSRSGT